MAIDRRNFGLGLAAMGVGLMLPGTAMARAGKGYLTAAKSKLDGTFAVARLDDDFRVAWTRRLPARAHATVQRPLADEGAVIGRRPGTYALVFGLEDGAIRHRLSAAPGRCFYGHGTFSPDGRRLLLTENAYETGDGVIGVYDATAGYKRLGEVASGGIGPHEIAFMPDGRTLVVANGGFRTNPPVSGRRKLNIPTMNPRLSYIDIESGRVLGDTGFTEPRQRKLSTRHVAVLPDGRVAVVCQDQAGPGDAMPLVYMHDRAKAEGLVAMPMPVAAIRRLNGYCGSVAIDPASGVLAVSSPRGGIVGLWGTQPDRWLGAVEIADGCGLDCVAEGQGFAATSGNGAMLRVAETVATTLDRRNPLYHWDNHLLRLT